MQGHERRQLKRRLPLPSHGIVLQEHRKIHLTRLLRHRRDHRQNHRPEHTDHPCVVDVRDRRLMTKTKQA